MRARELGLACGTLPPGEKNSIADVPGVTVGHATIAEGEVLTGVTAVLPHDGDMFTDRTVSATYVINAHRRTRDDRANSDSDTLLRTDAFA